MGFWNIFNRANPSLNSPLTGGYNSPAQIFSFSGDECTAPFTIEFGNLGTLDYSYNNCSVLSTVVNRCAMSYANAKWWVTDKDDKEVTKYTNLNRLLKTPNPLQTFTEFQLQQYIYRKIYGEVFIYASSASGIKDNKEALALWVLNPKDVVINLHNKLYNQNTLDGIVKSYTLTTNGVQQELAKENVLHIKDSFQNLNFNPTDIRGCSRIVGLEDQVNNLILAQRALFALNKNKGPQVLISSDGKDESGTRPLTPTEKETTEKLFRTEYGLDLDQKKYLFTSVPLKAQNLSFNVKDLMLFEGMESNSKQISSAFGYPYGLLSNDAELTYNNQNEQKKTFYQDTIIPDANLDGEKYTAFFGLTNGEKIYPDYSGVEALQEAEKDKAEAKRIIIQGFNEAYKTRVITLEEYRKALDLDIKPNPNETYYQEPVNAGTNQEDPQG